MEGVASQGCEGPAYLVLDTSCLPCTHFESCRIPAQGTATGFWAHRVLPTALCVFGQQRRVDKVFVTSLFMGIIYRPIGLDLQNPSSKTNSSRIHDLGYRTWEWVWCPAQRQGSHTCEANLGAPSNSSLSQAHYPDGTSRFCFKVLFAVPSSVICSCFLMIVSGIIRSFSARIRWQLSRIIPSLCLSLLINIITCSPSFVCFGTF